MPELGLAQSNASPARPRTEIVLLGVGLAVLSFAMLSIMDAISKLLAADYSGVQVTWARHAFHLIPLVVLSGPRRVARMVRTNRPGVQIWRGAALALSAALIIYAFSMMPLADAIAVSFVAPLITVGLSARFLGETVGWHRWAAVLIGFAGVLIMAWPSGGVFEFGAVLVVLAALFWAIAMMMTRQLKDDDPWSTLFYTAFVGTVLLSAAAPFFWTWPTLEAWGLMALMGSISGIAHALLINAFRHAAASVLAPFQYTALVWSTLLGWIVFDQLPVPRAAAGAAVILLAGLYVWHRERTIARSAAKAGLVA